MGLLHKQMTKPRNWGWQGSSVGKVLQTQRKDQSSNPRTTLEPGAAEHLHTPGRCTATIGLVKSQMAKGRQEVWVGAPQRENPGKKKGVVTS